MYISALFFLFGVTMLSARFAPRGVTLTLFWVTLLLTLATYLHHATDVLPLSL